MNPSTSPPATGPYPSVLGNTHKLAMLFMQAPAAMALLEGPEHIFRLANPLFQKLVGRTEHQLLGKTFRETFSEIKQQGIYDMLDIVFESGEPYVADQFPAAFRHGNTVKQGYYNCVIQPLKNEHDVVIDLIVHASEVTEQVGEQQKMRESEARFRSLILQAPVATCLFLGRDLKIDIANELMISYMGKGWSVLGKPLQDALPELKGQAFLEILDKVFTTGETRQANAVPTQLLIENEMKVFYFNYIFKPIRNEHGEIYAIIDMSVDVTEQVVARQRLEERNQQLKVVLEERKTIEQSLLYRTAILEAQNEAIPDAILVVDTKGKIISSNKQFETLWSIPEALAREKDDHSALAFASLQVADPEAFAKRIQECYAHPHQPVHDEIQFKDGRIIERYGNAVIGEDEVNYGWIWYFRDITAQREAESGIRQREAEFRQLANAMPQLVWVANAKGEVTYYNDRLGEFAGAWKDTEGNWQWTGLLHEDDLQRTNEAWSRAIQSGNIYEVEHRVQMQDNSHRWFLSRGVALKDDLGRVLKWFGTATDIQQQKQSSEQLERLVAKRTSQLQQSNDDLLQFAHVASHDLKEPVRKIKTFLGRLEMEIEGQLTDKASVYLQKIYSATDRMYTMINGVLAYSTINDNLESPQPVDLNGVIKDIQSDLEVVIHQKSAAIRYDRLPTLEGAPVLIYQLFYNLINNSLKFSKQDTPPIISIQADEGCANNGLFTRVSLSDNGIGFDSEKSLLIFDAFSRLNSKDKYEGTGLGLALCKRIVARHGGSIEATGRRGEGATFTITLPCSIKTA